MFSNIKIQRNFIEDTFAEYVSHYNAEDPKVKLKIDHTYRVAALCEQIAKSVLQSDMQIDVAWLLGMIHDIGRFEQLRRFGTFSDAQSIDHANFGADLLFQDGLLERYVVIENQLLRDLIEHAIRQHSVYRIDETLDETTKTFCKILRDADKIDILKVNHDVPTEDIYNVSTAVLKNETVSQGVMDNFKLHQATPRAIKETAVDHIVGHISLVYELEYPISYQLVKEQGYLDRLLDFESENEITQEQFVELKNEMYKYLKTIG